MHYTTVSVGLVEGHETQGIDDAIAQGLEALSKEIGGPVELVNVAFAPVSAPAHSLAGSKLCVTVMAKPYQPPLVPLRVVPETFIEKFARH